MNHSTFSILNPKMWLLTFCFCSTLAVLAQGDDGKHELDNMQVSILANEYKSSKFIDSKVMNGKEYIYGKPSSYNSKGEANAGILLQPNVEYQIKTKLPGGTYNVTVYYQIDKDKAPEQPMISIGMNTQKQENIEIKNKLINSVKASFKVNLLKGKHHMVKVWLPSEGVMVREIKVTRALLPQKKQEK